MRHSIRKIGLSLALAIAGVTAAPASAQWHDVRVYASSLQRAEACLVDATNALAAAEAELNAARVAHADAVARHRAFLSQRDRLEREAAGVSARLDQVRRQVASAQAAADSAARALAEAVRERDSLARLLEDRRAEARRNFELSPIFRDVSRDLADAHARVEQQINLALADLQRDREYVRLSVLRDQAQREMDHAGRFRWAGWEWQYRQAEQRFRSASVALDALKARYVDSDRGVIAARQQVDRVRAELDRLSRDFEARFASDPAYLRDLRRRDEMARRVELLDRDRARAESDAAALCAEEQRILSSHGPLLRDLDCARTDLANAQRDLDVATGVLAAAENRYSVAVANHRNALLDRDAAARSYATITAWRPGFSFDLWINSDRSGHRDRSRDDWDRYREDRRDEPRYRDDRNDDRTSPSERDRQRRERADRRHEEEERIRYREEGNSPERSMRGEERRSEETDQRNRTPERKKDTPRKDEPKKEEPRREEPSRDRGDRYRNG
jgi:hypothetical protein